jgi:hypothetical protein
MRIRPAQPVETTTEPPRAGSDPERLGRVIRGLASDLVEERRRANALAREVKELKAELAQTRRGS